MLFSDTHQGRIIGGTGAIAPSHSSYGLPAPVADEAFHFFDGSQVPHPGGTVADAEDGGDLGQFQAFVVLSSQPIFLPHNSEN